MRTCWRGRGFRTSLPVFVSSPLHSSGVAGYCVRHGGCPVVTRSTLCSLKIAVPTFLAFCSRRTDSLDLNCDPDYLKRYVWSVTPRSELSLIHISEPTRPY